MRLYRRNGITLVEVLIVISLIGLLLSLLIPAIQHARAAADKIICKNNLRELGIAMHNCHATRGTLFPQNLPPPYQRKPESILSWMALLLPELGHDNLYSQAVSDSMKEIDPFRHELLTRPVTVLACPSDSRLREPLRDPFGDSAAYTSYIGIISARARGQRTRLLGVFAMRRPIIEHVRDGASNTVAVGERPPPDPPLAGWWYPRLFMEGDKCHGPNNVIPLAAGLVNSCNTCAPESRCLGPGRLDNPCDRFHLWSLHPGGANFLFVDGSVRFFPYSADAIIPYLVSINGREPVEIPE